MKNTIFHNLRPSFLIIPCKPNCTLRISTNQVKMIGKPLKLTARHSKWEKGTFYRCNRTKQVVDLELENLNLDQSFWNGSPWNKVDVISQFCFKSELLGKTQIIEQKNLKKPRLLSRLGQCPGFERSRGFFFGSSILRQAQFIQIQVKSGAKTPKSTWRILFSII